jgi:hypothetical protein
VNSDAPAINTYNPAKKLATNGTQDEEKQNKPRQYVFCSISKYFNLVNLL